LVPAGGRYDRATALVRRLESRTGRLFSVHGQLLVWRARDALAPRPGVAADDIDLMYEARARGLCVELVRGARFVEVKVPVGADRDAQALRRARAYFDALRPAGALGAGVLDRLHEACYRHGPRLAVLAVPVWLLGGAGLSALGLGDALGPATAAGAGLVAALALGLAVPALRDLALLLFVASRAARASRRERSTDRWEMARR